MKVGGFWSTLGWRISRLGRALARFPRAAWRIGVEETSAELRRYRSRTFAWWKQRSDWRKQYKVGFWGDLPAMVVRGPLLLVQMALLAVAYAPILVAQSLKLTTVGLASAVARAPGSARVWVKTNSWTQLAVVAGLLVVATGAAGAIWYIRRRMPTNDVWAVYKTALNKGDVAAAREELKALKQKLPDDPRVDQRLAAWETGVGPEEDPEVVYPLMLDHLRNGRMPDAVREAGKYLKRYPDNWYARYILAVDAMARNAPAEAAEQVSHWPKPKSVTPPLHGGWIRRGMDLCRALRDTARADELLDYAAGHYLRTVAANPAAGGFPEECLMLADCYQAALVRFSLREDLIENWQAVQRLCRAVAASPEADAAQLRRLGTLQENHLLLIQEFGRRKLRGFADDKSRREAAAEIEEALQPVWARLLALEPAGSMGWLLKASQHVRAGQADQAVATLTEGLRAAAPAERPVLTVVRSRFLRLAGKFADDERLLDESLGDRPGDTQLLALKAESAANEGNWARALEACREASAADPKLDWARKQEARICLRLKRPGEAAAALDHIRAKLIFEPADLRLYVRTLAMAGRTPDADAVLKMISEDPELRKRDVGRPLVLSGAIGFAEAGKPADAGRWAEFVLAQRPADTAAMTLLADSLRDQVENGPKDWDPVKVRRAVGLYETLLKANPDDISMRNNLVWLQIKGAADRAAALRHSAPLRKAAESAAARPELLDTLAALCNLTGDFAEARKFGERALAAPTARFSYFLQTAEAMAGLGKFRGADILVRQAEVLKLPMTPRESADLAALRERIKDKL